MLGYTYDPVGNRGTRVWGGATTAYAYDRADRADRVTAAGGTAYTVDANGTVTARGTDSFTFDAANRLEDGDRQRRHDDVQLQRRRPPLQSGSRRHDHAQRMDPPG